MESEYLGSLLRECRERYHLSQEDLAFELCAVSTLSQIESGTVMPSGDLVSQLFGRLGMIPPAMPTNELSDKALIEMRIIRKVAEQDYDIEALLAAYKAAGKLTLFERQWYGYHRALYLRHSNAAPSAIVTELETAISLTIRDYRDDGLPSRRYYTNLERALLIELALARYNADCKAEARALAEYMQDYVEKRIPNEYDVSEEFTTLMQHLAEWQLEDAEPEKALATTKCGIDACNRFGELTPLAPLLSSQSRALLQLGKVQEANACRTDAEVIFAAISRANADSELLEHSQTFRICNPE